MSLLRTQAPGATRACPHCRATILQSAAQCPGCRGHLRVDAPAPAVPLDSPLRVEATVRHPKDAPPLEYSVVVAVRDAQGREIARHVVGVGALLPGDERAFSLSVEVTESRRAPANR